MKLSHFLAARQHLLGLAHLANLAYAFHSLSEMATRIARARLSGLVNLKSAEANEEACWASLTALEGNQSVIEEHFTDEDLMDLVDAVDYISDSDTIDLSFRIEDFATVFLEPLRAALEQAGVAVDDDTCPINQDTPSDLANNQ